MHAQAQAEVDAQMRLWAQEAAEQRAAAAALLVREGNARGAWQREQDLAAQRALLLQKQVGLGRGGGVAAPPAALAGGG